MLAQEGHPLKGSWLGDWGPTKTQRTQVSWYWIGTARISPAQLILVQTQSPYKKPALETATTGATSRSPCTGCAGPAAAVAAVKVVRADVAADKAADRELRLKATRRAEAKVGDAAVKLLLPPPPPTIIHHRS